MPTLPAAELTAFSSAVFVAAGARDEDAQIVSESLVGANLVGHDSHGVMRLPFYVEWMEKGWVNTQATFKVVTEAGSFAVIDGDWGFGQVMGRKATKLAIRKARENGTAIVAGRQCCHMGRFGEYPAMAAEAGMAAVLFANTHGGGKIVAPWGGVERRLSANPIAIGIPRKNASPIVVDVSTCTIAEGKIRNMRTAGEPVPEGCIIDAEGNPTTNAADFYGPPEGALLPFARHKGFALGLAGDILAGALSGAGCSNPDTQRVGNSFMLTLVDVEQVRGSEPFHDDVDGLVDYVKSSRLMPGVSEILMPGEPEERTRVERAAGGIPVHPGTWDNLCRTAEKYGVAAPRVGE